MTTKRCLGILISVLGLWLGACARTDPGMFERVYELPGDSVAVVVANVLSTEPVGFGLQSGRGDRFTTTFVPYSGPERGVWRWRRAWEERTRLLITLEGVVAPTYVTVRTETEVRPNPNYPWQEYTRSVKATELAYEFLRVLDDYIGGAR